jgi:hypothetical protein
LPFRTVTAPNENGCPWRKASAPTTPLTKRGSDVQPHLGVAERLARDRGGPASLPRAAERPKIGAHDDVRVEHRHEPIEVALTRGRQKRVDDLALRFDVRIGNHSLGAHAPARSARELARRLGGAIDDRRDLVEGHGGGRLGGPEAPILLGADGPLMSCQRAPESRP